ncbi:MFS transporter [Pimelobacter simplex]|uniref:MFS transporter n=1 Tax=Nocardioides simplex TaxID=2045 RepID=UPI003AABAEC4
MNPPDLSPRRRGLLWAAVVSGLLLAMLDQTIVGTALPRIVGDLGGPSWYVWAFTCYLVPATVLLPVATRLSDRTGRRDMLLLGMALFLVGSAVCALAGSMPVFVAGRTTQGAGAAALEALSFLVVNELARDSKRGAGQAAISAVMAISFIAGPLIGGLLTDHVGWRWAFLVNLPVGLAAMVMLVRSLPAGFGRMESRRTDVDLAGIACLVLGIGALLVALNRHQQLGDWLLPSTGGALVCGVLGIVLFLRVEATAAAPIVPLRLLADPASARLLLAGAFATTGLYACVLLVPRWYQLDGGLDATGAGIRVYPLLVALLVGVNVGAVLVSRGGLRVPLVAASAVTLAGALAFLGLGASSSAVLPLAAMALLGLGMGPQLSGLQIALSRSVAPRDLAAAMGTLLLGRQVIGAVALAAGDALFRSRAATHGDSAGTGWAIAWVAGAGAVVAALALVAGRRRPGSRAAARLPGRAYDGSVSR